MHSEGPIDRVDLASIEEGLSTGGPRLLLPGIRIAGDATAIGLATALAGVFRFQFEILEVTESSPLVASSHVIASLIWVAALLLALGSNRLFDEDTLFPGGGESARILRSIIEAGAAMSLFVFLTQSFYVSRSWFGLTLFLSLVALVAQRRLLRRHLRTRRRRGSLRRPCFLVSSEGGGWQEWHDVEDHEFEVLAELDPRGTELLATAVVADPELRAKLTGAALVLRARDFNSDEFWQLVLRAGQLGWDVFVHSAVRSVGRDRLTVRDIAGQTIVKVAPPMLRGARALQKRASDLVAASVVGIVALVPMVVISIAIAVTSRGPVLYRQERVGLGGKTFTMWKFRTMRVDAEDESGPVWTKQNDERRTRVGTYLRRTSFDELPQLFNVIKGDMSFIGPRPERPTLVDEFSAVYPWYRFRHRIRPGITGWAQVQGLRGDTDLDPRIASDNWYIENWSIWLDLKILWATVAEVVRGRNAY